MHHPPPQAEAASDAPPPSSVPPPLPPQGVCLKVGGGGGMGAKPQHLQSGCRGQGKSLGGGEAVTGGWKCGWGRRRKRRTKMGSSVA